MSFSHVRRDANRVADMISDIGVEGGRVCRMGPLEDFRDERWAPQCRHLATKDFDVN